MLETSRGRVKDKETTTTHGSGEGHWAWCCGVWVDSRLLTWQIAAHSSVLSLLLLVFLFSPFTPPFPFTVRPQHLSILQWLAFPLLCSACIAFSLLLTHPLQIHSWVPHFLPSGPSALHSHSESSGNSPQLPVLKGSEANPQFHPFSAPLQLQTGAYLSAAC